MTTPQTTLETPVYRALEQATADFLRPLSWWNIRERMDWDNAPIEAVRAFADALGINPHTTLFGEEYERSVVKAWQRWFLERDSASIIDLLASLLLVRVTPRWANYRTELTICFSPSPYRPATDRAYRQYVERVTAWLLPFYAEVDNLLITFCQVYDAELWVNSAYNARLYMSHRNRAYHLPMPGATTYVNTAFRSELRMSYRHV